MVASIYDVKSYACEVVTVEETETDEDGIEPRSIIEWRYKVENGILYRRKYNYTEECWIGDWEVVPIVYDLGYMLRFYCAPCGARF